MYSWQTTHRYNLSSSDVLVTLAQSAGVWRVISHRKPLDHHKDIEGFFSARMIERQEKGRREAFAKGDLGLHVTAVRTTKRPLHLGMDWAFSNGQQEETVAIEPYGLERAAEIASQKWTLSSAPGPRIEEGNLHLCARLEIAIPGGPIVDQNCALSSDRLQLLSLGYFVVGNEPQVWAYGFTKKSADSVEAVFADKSKEQWIQKNGYWVGFLSASKELRELWTVIEDRRVEGCGSASEGSCH